MTVPKLYTPEEAARELRTAPSYVRRLCRDGVLVAVNLARKTDAAEGEKKPRRRWVIPASELHALLIARGLVPSGSIVETDALDATVEAAAARERVRGSVT